MLTIEVKLSIYPDKRVPYECHRKEQGVGKHCSLLTFSEDPYTQTQQASDVGCCLAMYDEMGYFLHFRMDLKVRNPVKECLYLYRYGNTCQ